MATFRRSLILKAPYFFTINTYVHRVIGPFIHWRQYGNDSMIRSLNDSIGESAKGTAPSAARRTVREPLDSHGSPYRAVPYHSRQWTNSSDSRRDTFANQ
jgi:hypothetical protein